LLSQPPERPRVALLAVLAPAATFFTVPGLGRFSLMPDGQRSSGSKAPCDQSLHGGVAIDRHIEQI
jgi:hypothetical protein